MEHSGPQTPEANPKVQADITNAMTVDVEDYYQVAAFEGAVTRNAWDEMPSRVEASTDRVLALFARHGVKATFFTLGWVAERYPGLVRRIVDQGHEIASHGYDHTRVNQLEPKSFREDVTRTKAILEDTAGCAVTGYRAPTFSIGRDTLWALPILGEVGYRYSSSIYPVRHDLYGMPEAPRHAHVVNGAGLLEVPVSTVRILSNNFPLGGGGYFRLYPYALTRWAINRINQRDGMPYVFYTHPWEFDPDQPRQEGLSWKSRFRHYLNLDKVEARTGQLLQDFRWDRMDRIFLGNGA